MEKIIIGAFEYTYEERPIQINDRVINDRKTLVYTADISDADDIGYVVLSMRVITI